MASYAGLTSHPFPTCFACGTGRAEGDGLRIFPGGRGDADRDGARARRPRPGRPTRASPRTPTPTATGDRAPSLPVTWAALDCVGGWAGDLEERLMVLARMTARIDSLPVIGEEHVVVGLGRGREGRKAWTAADAVRRRRPRRRHVPSTSGSRSTRPPSR